MNKYAMALKNGKDIIHKTNQKTLEEAKLYFSKIKNLPLIDFNKIFIVIEINK